MKLTSNGSCCVFMTHHYYWHVLYRTHTHTARQDKHDDVKTGVKSTAILFGERTKQHLVPFVMSMAMFGCVAGINGMQVWVL